MNRRSANANRRSSTDNRRPATASLHVEQFGSGPDLVMLHGWGLHAGVWEGVAAVLARDYRVTLLDLPGHGRSPAPAAFTLDAATTAVAAVAPPRAAWVGWSLGGMIAGQLAATQPARVSALALVASSARFSATPDWPHAMDPQVLTGFAQALATDYRTTLERFVSLQADPRAEREALRVLRAQIFRYDPPPAAILNGGLDILRDADLRDTFRTVRCPTALVLGARDRLVPPAVGADMQRLVPQLQQQVIAAAGHAPFLSHPREFIALLNEFLTRHEH